MKKPFVVLLITWTSSAQAQYCPPYCGPRYAPSPYSGRGPLGDYIDRNYYCQGPGRPCSNPYQDYRGWRGNDYPYFRPAPQPSPYYYGPYR